MDKILKVVKRLKTFTLEDIVMFCRIDVKTAETFLQKSESIKLCGNKFEYADIKQIVEEISEVEITKKVIRLIHNKAKSFRQIVNTIDTFEKVAQANGLTQIDENIAKEVLNGGF